ncbi:MAG: MAPEG family protein [Bdellovibrionota bacterium]
MTIELQMLAAAIALGFVHLFLAITFATKQRGVAWNKGNREEPVATLTGVAFRLDQAFENFKETFPFFVAAVLAVQAGQRWGTLTMIGVHLYFWGRVAYLPIYAYGITGLRSLVWVTATVGIFLLLAVLILPLNVIS